MKQEADTAKKIFNGFSYNAYTEIHKSNKERKFMKKSRKKKSRICAAFLCICMLLSLPGISDLFPVVVAAEQEESFQINIITAFDPLSEDVKEQTVFTGTDLDELDLPQELTVSLLRESSEQEMEESEQETTGQEDAGESEDIEEKSDTEIGKEQDTQQEEGGESEGTDELTGTGIENVTDTENEGGSEGESAPVEEQGESGNGQESAVSQETHTVTMQEYQAENVIPIQTLESTQESIQTEKQEETVTIEKVTWKSEPEYDGSVEEIYTFIAVLPEGYALAEGVSLPEITVTVEENESGINAVIQKLIERIAALPDAWEYMEKEPDIDSWEGDEENYEAAYTEWMEGLQEYAGEVLVIWEEYETLTEEQQAQISEEELTKLTAWVEIAKTVGESMQTMAAVSAAVSAAPGEIASDQTWKSQTLRAGTYTIKPGVTVTIAGKLTVDGDVTITGGGRIVRAEDFKTETISSRFYCLFSVSKSGTLTLENITVDGSTSTQFIAPVVYVNSGGATLNLQTGALLKNNEYTGGENAIGNTIYIYGESKVNFSITYSGLDGAELSQKPTQHTWGTATVIGNPTKTNYTFAGWKINGGGTATTDLTLGEKDYTAAINLMATWTPNPYTISYTLDGGALLDGKTNPTSYTVETSDITLNNPTKVGYMFVGWSGTGLSGSNNIGVTIEKGSTGNRSYTANWTANAYTITYNGNGKTGGSTANSSHTYGTATALTANGFKREYTVTFNPNYTGSNSTDKTAAYTFAGWNTEADGSGTSYDNNASVKNLTETNNGTVTLYAQWTPTSVTDTPTRAGYTFAGWYTVASCSGSRVDSDGTCTPTGDMTLYAKWTPIGYTISYNLDGGTAAGNPTTYTVESSTITLKNPTKEGYTFTGWSGTDLTGNNNMSVTIAAGSTGDREYTAHWIDAGYKVTLNGNGGKGGTSLISYAHGTGAILPTDWTRTGYTFAGWYEKADCTGTAVTIIPADATGNKEYWAKWTDNIAPVIGTLGFNYQPKNFWHWLIGKDSLVITVPVTEEGSGTDKITYTVTQDGGTAETKTANITGGEAKITVDADFKGTVSIVCTDKAENTSAGVTVGAGIASNGIIIEDDAPQIAFQAVNAELLNTGEYKTAPNITVTVTDDKDNAISGGIASVSYQINGGSAKTVPHDYTASMVVSDSFTIQADEITASGIPADGVVISVTATDNAGNSTTETYTVKVHTHSGTLVPAVDPTCTTAGNKEHYTCTCGNLFSDSSCTSEITDQSTVVLDALGHHFEGEPYIVSTTQHWRKCSRCSVTEQKEDHTFGADDKCTVCGYSRAVDPGHTHSGTLVAAKPATCTEDGHEAYYTCSCGKWFSDSACTNEIRDHASVTIEKLGHNFVGQSLFDANGHWKVCSRCNTAQTAENHVFDDDNDTTCNKCGYQRTIGTHTHSVERTVAATEPTCTTEGNRAYYICSCGKWFSDSACTKEVTAQDVNIPAKGHTVVTDPAKAATCTETGLSEGSHCSVCGHVIKAQTVTAALGHDYSGNYHYDANGHWKVCSRCGTASAKQRHNYDNDRDTKCNDCDWVRTISDSGQDEQPTPTPTPEPPVSPTPQPPSPTNPPEQPQPTEKPDDPGTVPGTPDNSQPESTGTPEPTEKPSETGKEQQPEGDGEQTVPASIDNGKIAISGEPVATGNVEGMTDTRTVLKLGNGAVIVTVVCAEQEYTAGVADTLAVANAVLTPEQIQLVNNGETIEIRIDVKDISDQVPEQDKEVIENGIEEYRKEMPELVLGMYVDISMFIRIGEGGWNAITKAEEPVEIIIGIPEKLQEKDRAYYIIRAHDGIHTLMNDMDNEPSTITVSTDLFSSYAIAYVQAEGTGHKCGLCHICPTFLGICYFVWLAIIILIMIVVIILLRKKKEQETEDVGQ